tara:strand:+ start:215 stop:931 length:717 start_codon:yes stop_codon:yes gene_type:complete
MNTKYLEMSFWEHLEELRWCLIKIIISVLLASIIIYNSSEFWMQLLIRPSKSLSLTLQVLNVTSIFIVKLNLAIIGGLFLAYPFILYQIWKFISPAFIIKKNMILLLIITSNIFFIVGAMFAYHIIIPVSLKFFTSLITNIMVLYNFTLEGYLLYMISFIVAFGLIFQIPFLSLILTRIGLFTPPFLKQYRKVSILIFLIISAIITPPDPISQLLVVLPLILLYELSIIISQVFKPKH